MTATGAQRAPLELTGGLAACRRALGRLAAVELTLATVSFAFVVVLTILQVTLRYGFHGSIWWAQEVAQLAILISYFLGIAYVFKARHDVMIEFVFERLPPALHVPIFVLAEVLTITLALVAATMLVQLAPQQLATKTYILSIPKFYSSLPLLVGSTSMVLTAVYYIAAVATLFRRTGGRVPLAAIEDAVMIVRAEPVL